MAQLNWTNQAKNDLISIASFIRKSSIKYAKLQVKRIRNRAQQIAEFPKSGRVVPELDNPRIREVIIGNYRIIYFLVSEDRIDILTIHHSAKMLKM
ncbi:MAG: type II toxin-antitoxin system RelE/ParE family toxin [Cyclobacteriaceae bacterium]